MGQYHIVINLTKREYLNPHQLGDGLKLWEQVGIGGVATALHALLAVSNGRGGGDFRSDQDGVFVGRWGGDRIVVLGDYAEASDLPATDYAESLYSACGGSDEEFLENDAHRLLPFKPSDFTNISGLAILFMEKEFGFRYGGTGWARRSTDPSSVFHEDDGIESKLAPDMLITEQDVVSNPVTKRNKKT